MMPGAESANRKAVLICLALVLVVGSVLRLPPALFAAQSAPLRSLTILHPIPKWTDLGLVGVDEGLYRDYVDQTRAAGMTHYPDIVRAYIVKQRELPGAILPPTRFFYIFSGYIWHSIFGSDALAALKNVASLFSILSLGLAAFMAWRIHGPVWSIPLAALVAFAPTQLHTSQHAMIDGVFAFWAVLTLWLLWENLRAPRQWGWLIAYSASLACLVLTKETAFFVWLAVVVLLLVNRWLRFGTVPLELVAVTIAGPALGVLALVIVAGGPTALIEVYHLFVTKNYALPYVAQAFDGPWQRYLVDLLLVSPIVTILAVGAAFRMDRTRQLEVFFIIFLAVTYVAMCNLKYGMNLRFANMWDVPLRFVALGALVSLVALFRRRQVLVLALAVAFICALEIRQYQILFVEHSLHELASDGLLRALKIVK